MPDAHQEAKRIAFYFYMTAIKVFFVCNILGLIGITWYTVHSSGKQNPPSKRNHKRSSLIVKGE